MADASRFAPADEHDARLLANVHPAGWINPEPAARYNLVVIGAGTAGLVAAAGAAGLGASRRGRLSLGVSQRTKGL